MESIMTTNLTPQYTANWHNTCVILICYNRPRHTQQVLNSLERHKVPKLLIFSDAAKTPADTMNVNKTRSLFQTIHWTNPEIIMQDENQGLAKSITQAIEYAFSKYEHIILLEDDCVPKRLFFEFIFDSLNKYADNEKIMGISGYSIPLKKETIEKYPYDAYVFPRMGSWGWAMWKNRWRHYERDLPTLLMNCIRNKIDLAQGGSDVVILAAKILTGELSDIWTIPWLLSVYLHRGFYIYPITSHLENIGFDGTGIHCGITNKFNTWSTERYEKSLPEKINLDDEIYCTFRDFYEANPKVAKDYYEKIKQILFEKPNQTKKTYILTNTTHLKNTGIKINPYNISLDIELSFKRFGNDYGGWNLFQEPLTKDSTIYSVGVGEDASFDIALINTIGAKINAFDPTPKSINWVKNAQLPHQFVLHEIGLADFDDYAYFNPPENPNHVSHTILDRPSTSNLAIKLPVKKLITIMKKLGHPCIDLLKMDIEGAEYQIIDDLYCSRIYPAQILVEFHHRFPTVGIAKTLDAIELLRKMGYKLYSIVKEEEFSFIHESLLHYSGLKNLDNKNG
jgi:FkbM family methyltransferase